MCKRRTIIAHSKTHNERLLCWLCAFQFDDKQSERSQRQTERSNSVVAAHPIQHTITKCVVRLLNRTSLTHKSFACFVWRFTSFRGSNDVVALRHRAPMPFEPCIKPTQPDSNVQCVRATLMFIFNITEWYGRYNRTYTGCTGCLASMRTSPMSSTSKRINQKIEFLSVLPFVRNGFGFWWKIGKLRRSQ